MPSRKVGLQFVLVLALVSVVVLLGADPVAKEKTWVVTVLEGPPGKAFLGSFGNDVSDSGYVVGGWFDGDDVMRAAYWYKGKIHDLPDEIGVPTGTVDSYVNSVNSNGLMGGGAILADSVYRAMLWNVKKGTYTNLHPSGDEYAMSRVVTVNSSGDAVGMVTMDDGTQVAWVWPKGDTTGEALPGLSDYDGTRAAALNSSGMIVGQGQDGTWLAYGVFELPVWVPLVWIKKGKSYELVDLRDEFDDGNPMIRAYDVSEDGQVIGRLWNEILYTSAWSWTADDGVTILDDGDTGDASAWRVAGKTITGGIGYGPLGTGEQDWISDDAAIWVNGKLEIVATEVVHGNDTYEYVDGASSNKSGLVTGFCFLYPSDPPYLPLGWIAEKK